MAKSDARAAQLAGDGTDSQPGQQSWPACLPCLSSGLPVPWEQFTEVLALPGPSGPGRQGPKHWLLSAGLPVPWEQANARSLLARRFSGGLGGEDAFLTTRLKPGSQEYTVLAKQCRPGTVLDQNSTVLTIVPARALFSRNS